MIAEFLRGLESVFTWLLEASWQASVLVALVLLLQMALRGRLNPRWHHALWLLVVLRLVLPVLPESALSLFQFAPQPPPAITRSVTEPIFVTAPAEPVSTVHLDTPAPAYPFSLYSLLALTWLAGACGFLLVTWMVNHRFGRHVRNAPAIDDPRLREIAAAAQTELGLHRSLRLIESTQINSPAIMGIFQPTLLLPVDVRARFSDEELRFIFLHEFAHLKRGDLVVQWCIALLQILHWFNPVLWYAFRRMRIDREPATDALVLSRTGEAEKDRYGHVLIKLLEHYQQRHSFPTLVGILEDKDQFKRRFALIARFTHGAYGWSLLGVLLIGFLSVACLTKGRASENATSQTQSVLQESATTRAEVSGKSLGVMIRIAPKVVQIDEDDYQAHRIDIDSAVQRGDVRPLSTLKSYNLLSSPAVLTNSGEQGVLETVRVLPYPTAFEKQPDGTFKPTDFKRQNLGLRFVVFPTFIDGKINFKGDLNITSLEKWIQTKENPHQPVFHVRELPVSESFLSAQTKGFEMPGGAQMEPSDPAFYFAPDKIPDSSKDSKVLRRIFLFLNAQAFHEDGREITTLAPTRFKSKSVTISGEPQLVPAAAPSNPPDLNVQLLTAVQKGDVATVQKLLGQGVDPNAKDCNPVYWAVYYHQPATLKVLLDHGAEANRWNLPTDGGQIEAPIQLARRKYPDLVLMLQTALDRGRDIDIARTTACLDTIHVQLPAFSSAPLADVIGQLGRQSFQNDPGKRGIGFIILKTPASDNARITLAPMNGVSVADALKAISAAANLTYTIEGPVYLRPATTRKTDIPSEHF